VKCVPVVALIFFWMHYLRLFKDIAYEKNVKKGSAYLLGEACTHDN